MIIIALLLINKHRVIPKGDLLFSYRLLFSHPYNSYVDYAKEILQEDKMLKEILSKAEQEDIKQQEYIKNSNLYIESNLKGFIARNLYGTKYYYKAVQQNDETLQTALKIIKDDKQYNKILKSKKK